MAHTASPKQVVITDQDSVVLDTFTLAHWQLELDEDTYEDVENYGSPASESLLMDRLRRVAERG